MLGRVVSSSLLLRRDLLLLFFAGVEDVEDVETGFGGGVRYRYGMGRRGDGGLRVNVAGKVAEEGEADVDEYYIKVR